MNQADIDRLFAYHRWANGLMLDAVAPLSHEQQTQDLKSSFPSILATLTHMLSGDWIWLQRWNGTSPPKWPEMDLMTDFAKLRARWAVNEREQGEFIGRQTEASYRVVLNYRNLKGEAKSYPLGDVCQHVVNHATYHRGQITTMIRQVGGSMVSTDFVTFLGV